MSAETRPAASGDLLLEARDLSVEYGEGDGAVHAVVDVSFTLRRGEILGLAGESGSGKSTLAYAIARLLRPPAEVTAGRVLYHPRAREGRGWALGDTPTSEPLRHGVGSGAAGADDADGGALDILALSPSQLRAFRWNELAIVFQSAMNALNPIMTVGAQITDVLATHRPGMSRRARDARAEELLRLVGISADRLGSYPHELSGGMRQRATIAIALALAPELIIMDEPTTALDVVVQREILAQLIALRTEFGFSVIFITHDLSLLLEVADTIAIMYAGRIVEHAARRDLRAQPRHPYSFGLLNSFPSLRGPRRAVTGIPGSPPDLRSVPPGCAFHPRCPFAFAPCASVLPPLRPAVMGSAQRVACHLYDPAYSAAPPTTAELAAGYAAKARG